MYMYSLLLDDQEHKTFWKTHYKLWTMERHLNLSQKIISESVNGSTKQADSLSTMTHIDDTAGVKIPTRKRDDISLYSDSTLKLEYIDDGTDVDSNDLKPIVKDLSNMLSKVNDSFNTFSSSCVKTEMEHDDKMFIDINQSTIKQETLSLSLLDCEVKDEKMHCQSCSYSNVDLGKLKSHKFTQHPTEAAVAANCFGETDHINNDIRFFCVKETCSFSTALCILYELHLLHCCSMHQSMTRIEIERLKSTIKLVLDFHNKLGLDTVSGFLDFVSSFNKIYTSDADQDKINEEIEYGRSSSIYSLSNSVLVSDVKPRISCVDVRRNSECSFSWVPSTALLVNAQNTDLSNEVGQIDTMRVAEQDIKNKNLIVTDSYAKKFPSSSEGEIDLFNIKSNIDHLVSNNVELENDIAGEPLYDNNASYSEEMKEDNIKDEVNFGTKCNKCGKIFVEESNLLMPTRTTHDKDEGFECDECTECSDGDIIPLSDTRKHKEERRFKCSECGKGFNEKSSLMLHMSLHRGEKPFSCKECGKCFSEKSNFSFHMRAHAVEKPYKCVECGKGFSLKSGLTLHMRVHTGEKPFNCNECGKQFSRKIGLTLHDMRVHIREKPFVCNECGKGFSEESKFTVHMRLLSGEKPYRCNECGKGFRGERGLTEHVRFHTGEKPFKCNECGKDFSLKGQQRAHMRLHTVEKLFKCNECGKGFRQKGQLTVHMRLHTGEKPFMCLECGRGFGVKSTLKAHIRVHTGERRFRCNECGRDFGEKGNLTRHMRLHTGEKPFMCYECGKVFREKCTLTKHTRVHTGEKPFKCNECGNVFSEKSSLTAHMRRHTGEKPYKCKECGKGFRIINCLTVHMRLHTGEKPFKCNECGKGFRHKNSLTLHMKLHVHVKESH